MLDTFAFNFIPLCAYFFALQVVQFHFDMTFTAHTFIVSFFTWFISMLSSSTRGPICWLDLNFVRWQHLQLPLAVFGFIEILDPKDTNVIIFRIKDFLNSLNAKLIFLHYFLFKVTCFLLNYLILNKGYDNFYFYKLSGAYNL